MRGISAKTAAHKQPFPLTIQTLERGDRPRWDEFVEAHADGTFYHLSGWQVVIGDYLRHPTYYLFAERGVEIEGVLPLARIKSWLFGDALISLPFLVYGGPVASSTDACDALVEAATRLADELGVDYLELRNRQPVTPWRSRDTYVTFRKSIDPDVEANLKSVPRKQRAMIRKGIKAGLGVEIDADATRLAAIMTECKRNLGTPFFSQAYLQKVKDVFGDKSKIMTVCHEGVPVAGVMSFYFRDEVLPYYGGGTRRARTLYANDYMYWQVMEHACRAGVKLFDYGRSQKDTGPYRFKKHWGFEPEPLSYEVLPVRKKEIPNLHPGNPRYRLFVEAWTRLPLSIATQLGPPIARRIG